MVRNNVYRYAKMPEHPGLGMDVEDVFRGHLAADVTLSRAKKKMLD